MVVGLIEADGGSIKLDGQNITGLPMHSRAKLGIGYLPQEPSVFRRLSVADNIMAVLELREGLSPRITSYNVCYTKLLRSPTAY